MLNRISVVLEFCHPAISPVGPVFRSDAAGLGPRINGIKVIAPHERPQFLEPHRSHVIVYEYDINGSTMAVIKTWRQNPLWFSH